MSALRGKSIVLGLSGGIAIYKVAGLLRRLSRDLECNVQVVMTNAAEKFMSPLIFETFSGKEVICDMFNAESTIVGTRHIDLIQEADLVALIPATANIIGKIASGIADDALSTMLLVAQPEKTLIAPAMNKHMYLNPTFQKNLKYLKNLHYHIIEPDSGELATQLEGSGIGRLPDEKVLLHFLEKAILSQKKTPLLNKRVLITGGPTREAIDDIRFISNPSTGKMGIALAESAAKAGAIVTYISGPTFLPDPIACTTTIIQTAEEMKTEVLKHFDDQDIVVMSSAVEDIRPIKTQGGKIKKQNMPDSLKLERTPDILFELGQKKTKQLLVGFSVEVEKGEENSKEKIRKKNLDWIVHNNPKNTDTSFASDNNQVVIISKNNDIFTLPKLSKADTADEIWRCITKTDK